MSVEAAARGILAIVDHHMVGALRLISVERGHDPREFTLLPFGGAGPLHGGSLSRLLGTPTVLVPPGAGVLSAYGLLASSLKAEFSRTCLQKAGVLDIGLVSRVFRELEAEAAAWFEAEQVPPAARRLARVASVRYQNQGFELFVPWEGDEVTEATAAGTVAAFHRMHERLYTFAQEDTPVEIVTVRVDAQGAFSAPQLQELPPGSDVADAIVAHHPMHLEDGTMECPVYDRTRIGAGARIAGPAVVAQLDATTLILPGQTADVDRLGNLIIREDG
jgi:N-methylhydantoinase A